MGSTPAAYLLAATTDANWNRPVRGAEFFASQDWSTAEVREDYADWFRSYEKRNDPRPELLPARGTTVQLGAAQFSIAGTGWTLKLSRVDVEPREWFEWHPLLVTA